MDELETKNNFLLLKANKLKNELHEQKVENQTAINKVNASLFLNQKLEEYVSHPGDVLNKAQLFDNNLATNPVSAAKVIPILVDFAAKMEELLNNMRSLFDELGPKANQEVALEHVPDLSLDIGDILSPTSWRQEPTPTKTPTKPAQPKPSELTKETQEKEPLHHPKSQPTPLEQVAGVVTTTREIRIDDNEMARQLLEGIQDRPDQLSRLETPQQTARIDVVQIEVDKRPTERMQEFPTPPKTSTPEPT